jgi:FkbM family methyltransferase
MTTPHSEAPSSQREASMLRRFARLLFVARTLRTKPGRWPSAWRLLQTPRFQPGATSLCGSELRFVDAATFLSAYSAIFGQDIFRFQADQPFPYFIDCGANIGLSVLYLKQRHPNSTVVAFEPDPSIFQVLQENVHRLNLQNVELRNQAVWDSEGEMAFYAEGSDSGRLLSSGDISLPAIKVPTVSLRDLLDRQVDFLKIDIEGAETQVLVNCSDRLHQVKRLFVEYHSYAGQQQTLHILISTLIDAGFRLLIGGSTPPDPFLQQFPSGSLDMLLNIFAYRP